MEQLIDDILEKIECLDSTYETEQVKSNQDLSDMIYQYLTYNGVFVGDNVKVEYADNSIQLKHQSFVIRIIKCDSTINLTREYTRSVTKQGVYTCKKTHDCISDMVRLNHGLSDFLIELDSIYCNDLRRLANIINDKRALESELNQHKNVACYEC